MPGRRIAALVAAGQLSPVEVTEHFLGRAEDVAGRLRCFQELDAPGAREQARVAERAVLAGDPLGPLHGVPVGVKANVPVAGFGLYALFGETKPPVRVTRDAAVVRRLRDAGAVVMGTTVVPGMGQGNLRDAAGEATPDLSCHPRNPWDLEQSARVVERRERRGGGRRGPSGGDRHRWRGSTRLPAAWCGVVGLHPTLGRVPGLGRGASGWSTSVGPITRDAVRHRPGAASDRRTRWRHRRVPPRRAARLPGRHRLGGGGLRTAWTDDFGFARTYPGPESERVLEVVRTRPPDRLRELGAVGGANGRGWRTGGRTRQ